MADISMCQRQDCPVRNSCYRYRAIPYLNQAYFLPKIVTDKGCSMYWPLSPRHRTRSEKEIKDQEKQQPQLELF